MSERNVDVIYHCQFCGQVAVNDQNGGIALLKAIKHRDSNFILKVETEVNAPTELNKLLKIEPGKSVLDGVVVKLGSPFAKHKLKTGILLCYHSDDPHNPHSILVDPRYKVVKLVAIHNDNEAFDLNNLGDAYGQEEFVARTDGFEFWIYEAHGVAKVTEGFSDEAILFVQFFEKRLDMNHYMEMNCFLEETFMCQGPDTGWPE